MIFIGIGANLPSMRFGAPLNACQAACKCIENIDGVDVLARSLWYESAPVPLSDQPWFVNGVISINTDLGAEALLMALHVIESEFGRVRGTRNAPRVLDLDLLAYEDKVNVQNSPKIPHPRLSERAFVVLPLAEIAPGWVHPQSGENIEVLVGKLPKDQICRPLPP